MAKRYWEWSAPFRIVPEETALIVVDMQKAFVDEGWCMEVPMAREQVPAIRKLVDACHEKKIPVFFSAFAQAEDFCYDYYWKRNRERGLLREDGSLGLAVGLEDEKITEALTPTGDDIYFLKYGYDCFAHTELEKWLQERGVKTVIVCGTVVNWCVDSTIRSAYHKDYNVVAVADAVSGYPHAGLDPQQWCDAELDLWGEAFARVMSSGDIIAEIKGE